MMSYSIASCTIQLVTNENPVNSYLILTVDKTIMAQSLLFFLCNFCSILATLRVS